MKKIYGIIALLSVLALGSFATSCIDPIPAEITELDLTRCLEPMNLSAKVTGGDYVTFTWDVTKDAESYWLEVYDDPSMSSGNIVKSIPVYPEDVPYSCKMYADETYYFRVQARNERKGESNWAVYEKAVKTYAVRDNLYPEVIVRESKFIIFVWSTDLEDYKDLDRIEYSVVGSEDVQTYTLSEGDRESGSCSVADLKPSTNYDFVFYFKSAARGEVSAWTLPDFSAATIVSTSAALEQAIKDGATIQLTMDGSPYTIANAEDGGLNITKPFKILGQSSADGTKPVIYGAISIDPAFEGGDIYFEGVEFNGKKYAIGHPICLKNGGTGSLVPVNSITYKNCTITGYSKGLIYEWNQTFKLGSLTWDSCKIDLVNGDGAGGGDGIDFRGKTECGELNVINSTVTNGFRTFVRIDAGTWGKITVNNNTFMNLCFSDNTNNAGIIAINKDNGTAVGETFIKNNLFLYMGEKATFGSANVKYYSASDLAANISNNWFYSIPETFFNDNFPQGVCLAGGGKILDSDPCFNAKGGFFNLTNVDAAAAKVGAPEWWVEYVEKPEDLTLEVIEGAHTWDFTNAKYFIGAIEKSKVRDQILMKVTDNKLNVADGVMYFTAPTVTTKKGVPTDGFLAFKVNQPGAVYIKPYDAEGLGNHVIIGVGDPDGGSITVKGGAAANADMTTAQKILISDITEDSIVYLYASGPIGIEKLAWSLDCNQVNTALGTPEPKAAPESFTAGEAKDVKVTWNPVDNAGSYSVVFGGKTYNVEDALEYVIEGKTTSMLDAGSYTVEVYANPSEEDIYNTQSSAGVAAFAVLPAGGSGGDDEFVVSSVEELNNAIAAGKQAITIKYDSTPYAIGAVTITAPLKLKGQTSGDKKTPITASFTLSGEIGGSFILDNFEFVGDGTSVIIDDKTNAPVADTVSIVHSYLHGTKAIYDNSGKATSDIQYVIFEDNVIDNCSAGADFIDMRAGAHHNFIFVNNTVANSCRTFVRTDAGHEMNYATIRNNTFYKVATNSSSKDNNGILHIRSAAGAGLIDYKVQNNLFYSILFEAEPEHANGFPKLKSGGGLVPNTITNNYFFNCEDREEWAAYSFWKNLSKEDATVGGGAILPSDPCKDAASGDFTLINGVAMNANVGDPRWNPTRPLHPDSEITVKNIDELLTAISAGKGTITLEPAVYDFTSVDYADISNGKLTLVSSLNLVGNDGAEIIGGFIFKEGVKSFSVNNVKLNGNSTVDNVFEVADAAVVMNSFNLANCYVTAYKNRLFYMNVEGYVGAVDIMRNQVKGVSGADFTSGDFIDVRKGSVAAFKVRGNTFADGIRTFIRVDAAVVCNSVLIENNTFYNVCYAISKDNNGIMHVRSNTATAAQQVIVRSNIFAGLNTVNPEKLADQADNVKAAGFPKLVSKASAAIFVPVFQHNYFYDLYTEEPFSFWQYAPQEAGTAGYGLVLAEDPFKDAASGDFTLVSALAASEKVGDPRWNTYSPVRPDGYFEAASVEALLNAIDAGKTNIVLTGEAYDFQAVESMAGKLPVVSPLNIKGQTKCGLKPVVNGVFELSGECSLTLNNLKLDGASALTDMIVIAADANVSAINLVNCDVINYKNRLISGPNASVTNSVTVTGCQVSGVDGANFTSGDFIDFRKGTVNSIKVTKSTFANAIRTFLRVDAGVVCGAVHVENNTFYNICTAVSKDNNGIMHVRSSSATANPRNIVVRKNIFACEHNPEVPEDAADNVKGASFPKLVSTASEKIAHPYIVDNLFFDIVTEDAAGHTFWNTMTAESISEAGTVLSDTPFSGDPTNGAYIVKSAYKGYGDLRW